MSGQRSFFARLSRYYLLFTAGFAAFLLALSVLEQEGMSATAIHGDKSQHAQ